MRTIELIRSQSSDEGTFGDFRVDDGTHFVSGELPWRNNAKGISCIPCGTYPCHWFNSPKHGYCYQVYDVPDRGEIEIHSANFMGDTSLGFASQILGCITLGKSIGQLTPEGGKPQKAVLQSRIAIQEFELNLNMQDFLLTVKDA